MSQADGRKLSEFDGVQSSIRRNDEVIRDVPPVPAENAIRRECL